MIEKVTLQMTGEGKFRVESGSGCEERITPKRFEISYSGELSAETVQSESVYRSFHVVYNIECDTEDDQAKVGRAVELTHEKYCGMVQMLHRIAPVSREIAVVSTQPAKA